jgi:hypothetical protein
MSEEAGRPQWLPPQAPGAEPPRKWHSVDEAPAAPAPPTEAPPTMVPSGAAERPTGIEAPATRGADWWRHGDPRVSAPAPAYSPADGGRAATAATNGHAVAALSLGIAGLLLFVVSGFGLVFILNLPCSILAWMLGVAGMRRVDRGETTVRRGMAQAGMLLGVIGTVIGGLAIVAWALGFIFSEELRDEFQREWDRRNRG